MKSDLRRTERRQFGRRSSCLHGWVCVRGRARIPCVVRNLSQAGALLEIERADALPFRIRLVLDTVGIEIDCEIKHVRQASVGVSFASNNPDDASATAMRIAELFKTMNRQKLKTR